MNRYGFVCPTLAVLKKIIETIDNQIIPSNTLLDLSNCVSYKSSDEVRLLWYS